MISQDGLVFFRGAGFGSIDGEVLLRRSDWTPSEAEAEASSEPSVCLYR